MRCSRCQQENPLQAKFCNGCGARLEVACAGCGQSNPPESRFCNACGVSLVGGAAEPSRLSSPEVYTPKHLAERILTSKASLEGERKQVTVLFADLKGSMELLADRDAEEARKLLDPVLEHMMEAVHRYEGMVNQVMGDGIMALFGAPIAHEDHAVRACYAALRMQESVKRYADGVFRTYGISVRIRVGLNSGDVIVRTIGSDLHVDYTAVGQTTNLAARMEQAAAPGAILVTAETLRLAEGFIQVTPLGPLQVKGLAAPVEVYEVTGAGPVRTRLQAAVARGLTRFVGRQVEMEQLREALDQAGRGQGQVVAVVGEPGVGKSRLFHEFVHSHRTHGWRVLEGSSISHGKASAYLPVVDLLRSYFRIDARDDLRAIRAKVTGTLVTLDQGLADAVPPILELLDALPSENPFRRLEAPERRQITLSSIKRLCLCECRIQPLLVVLEDLHWIDSETQAVLDGLVESLPTTALLLAVNYRPEYRHGWGGKTYYRQLRIDPLTPESAAELLHHLVGDDTALNPLKALLIERTEGNPFFLEEAVRTLVETRVLEGKRGSYRLSRPVVSIQVPASVHAILAARIDRLPPDDKQLLQAAAVVGKYVPLPLLQGASDLTEDEVTRGLARLQAAEFLYETNLFPDPEYTFRHALTHEVTYGSLIAERRRTLHAQVLETIERRFSNRLSEHVEQLAYHAHRAERWEQMLHYQRQAGQKAALRSAHREAIVCFDQALNALAHLPDGPQTQEQAIDIRLELRASLYVTGDIPRIPGVLKEAETLATDFGDRRRLALVLASLGNYYWEMAAEPEQAGNLFERVLDIARELGDPQLETLAFYNLGRNLYTLGQFSQAIELLGKASEACQEQPVEQLTGQRFEAVNPIVFLARALIQVGQFGNALACAERALVISETEDYVFGLVHARYAIGAAHLRRGDFSRAIPVLERGLELARARSVVFMEPFMCGLLGLAYALSGRISEGLPLLEEGVRGAESMGLVGFSLWCRSWLGEGYLLAGQRAEAVEAVRQCLDFMHRRQVPWPELELFLGDIEATAEPQATEEAARHYTKSLAQARELGMRPFEARCHLSLGQLYRRSGQCDQAREHLAAAITMMHEMDMIFWLEQAQEEMRGLAEGQLA